MYGPDGQDLALAEPSCMSAQPAIRNLSATLVRKSHPPQVCDPCCVQFQRRAPAGPPPPVSAAAPRGDDDPRACALVISEDGGDALTLPLTAGAAPALAADGSVSVQLGNTVDTACTAVFSATDDRALSLLHQRLAAACDAAAEGDNAFDAKTERASAAMYFQYYGMLQHQQNMLQDATRTGTYFWAMMGNRSDFEGAVVVDVGAGSGILSLFAAQAGARKVYAIEASAMARHARRLFDGNPGLGERIELVHGKLEAVSLPEKADILISEPMGTLLVNERMLETYIHARRRFLRPGGLMFPSLGRIHVAAFSDAALFVEQQSMGAFWSNAAFYGVNLTPLLADATAGFFGKVVVDAFDPGVLASTWATHPIDFASANEADLEDIVIPLAFVCKGPGVVHGVACWFDVLFGGTTQQTWLSTAPGMPPTHWFQLRCVFQTPLQIHADGQTLEGTMRLKAHAAQSYDIHVELATAGGPGGAAPQHSAGVFDLKDPYYRQLKPTW